MFFWKPRRMAEIILFNAAAAIIQKTYRLYHRNEMQWQEKFRREREKRLQEAERELLKEWSDSEFDSDDQSSSIDASQSQ